MQPWLSVLFFMTVAASPNESATFNYRNLSCPFEWSKYSCAHRGKVDIASTCNEYLNDQLMGQQVFHPPTGRILIVGDSQMRQVFIGMACALQKYTETSHVDWQPMWPCHNTENCISGGVHSGFDVGSIFLRGGAEIHFLPHSGSLRHNNAHIMNDMLRSIKLGRNPEISQDSALVPRAGRTLTKGDMFIYNIGIHLTAVQKAQMLNVTAEFGHHLLRSGPMRPTFVYIGTPTQHFQTRTGAYKKNSRDGCQKSVQLNAALNKEAAHMLERQNVDHFVTYNDLKLGHLHIGGDDCTHYCMPGVPDLVAANIIALAGRD